MNEVTLEQKELWRCVQRIRKAYGDYKRMAEDLMATVREQLPVGTLLEATFGKARIRCRVERHSESWWNRPQDVTVVNIATGKRRTLSTTYEGHEIQVLWVDRPAVREAKGYGKRGRYGQ